MVDEQTVRRLVFVRYLYGVAAEQSRQAEPMNQASLLTIHDSVELFLQVAAEKLGVSDRNIGFMEYWPRISGELGDGDLGHKMAMDRLNRARVNLKHHGNWHAKQTIDGLLASAREFLEESAARIFGIEFHDLSLIDLVQDEGARKLLHEAYQLLEQDEREDALDRVGEAFARILDSHTESARRVLGRSPFDFGRSRDWRLRHRFSADDREAQRFIRMLTESLDELRTGLSVLGLGLDYRRYARFMALAPYAVQVMSGEYVIHRRRRTAPPAVEDCRFCLDFVVESAIRVQEFGFDGRGPGSE